MRTQILALALIAASSTAIAAPSLIATTDAKGGVNFEFVADPSQPVAAFNIEMPLVVAKKGQAPVVPEACFAVPTGFTTLCNVDNGVFKAIVYTTDTKLAMPSTTLGRVALPAGSISIAKSGEISGLKLVAADATAKTVAGEVLSESAGQNRAVGSSREK